MSDTTNFSTFGARLLLFNNSSTSSGCVKNAEDRLFAAYAECSVDSFGGSEFEDASRIAECIVRGLHTSDYTSRVDVTEIFRSSFTSVTCTPDHDPGAYASAVALIFDKQTIVAWWIGKVTAAISWSGVNDFIATPDTVTVGRMPLLLKSMVRDVPMVLNCITLRHAKSPDAVFLGSSDPAQESIHLLPDWARKFSFTEAVRLATSNVGILLAHDK